MQDRRGNVSEGMGVEFFGFCLASVGCLCGIGDGELVFVLLWVFVGVLSYLSSFTVLSTERAHVTELPSKTNLSQLEIQILIVDSSTCVKVAKFHR